MTIEAPALMTIQQTLNNMQNAVASSTVGPSGSADTTAFAQSLAQASSELSATEALMGATASPFAASTWGAGTSVPASGNDAEVSLIALLLSAQGTASPAPANGAIAGSVAAPAGALSGSNVVREAAQFEGTPYVWGGTTPQGFDCSGFVQYVYHQLGISLPRTSEEQASVGTAVPDLASAQAGDLLFFAGSDGSASSPGHVGIYMGSGQMIDAPYTGTTVQVQSLSSAGPIVAIRRVASEGTPASTMMGRVSVPGAYVSTIEQAASANAIPASLLAALLSQESGFNPSAVSSAGAQGIAQFMPSTAAGMGLDPYDPTQAINGAAKLLGSYTARFGSFADALAAYNAGPSAVARYGGIPPYAQTQAYVPAVLSMAGLSKNQGGVS